MLSKTQVKYIQSLGQKKFRDEYGVFIAEGPKLAGEILTNRQVQVMEIVAEEEWIEQNRDLLANVPVFTADKVDMGRISLLKTPNQVLLVVKKITWEEPLQPKNGITLVLDTLQDPGNFGTLVRIADWFGIGLIVCSTDCADLYNPKVVQATMGSLTRVRVEYTDLLNWVKTHSGIPSFAAVLDGKDVREYGKIKEGLLIIGNESKGIREDLLSLVKEKITIPRKGEAESLNAAVAAGILLSHLT